MATKKYDLPYLKNTTGRKVRDLAGQKFGSLTVISLAERDNHGSYFWNCVCACGTRTQVRGYSLLQGVTTSCGCKRKQHKGNPSRFATPVDAAWAYRFSQYQANARYRKISFNLSQEEFVALCSQSCHYCDCPPEMRPTRPDSPAIAASGVDRIDNEKGYEAGNVVPCCSWCNAAKRHHSQEDFVAHCIAVANHKRIVFN